ncbi:MAG: family 43 glycosylhydrolase [Clostridia bacterium]|nr:family 43 glycosylhydrolase [Clostridia bacterium]
MLCERIPRPRIEGEFVLIYRPGADVYKGPDSLCFRNGVAYDEWIPNDFSLLRVGDCWHMVGITHPRPAGLASDYDYDGATVHDGEFQLFHAEATGETFASLVYPESFAEREKILWPQDRPGEINEIWAPHLMQYAGGYRIIYSPHDIRAADSRDFVSWQPGRVLFRGEDATARDPFVYCEDGIHYLLYVVQNCILCRTSRDNMQTWDAPFVMYENPFASTDGAPHHASCESPFLLKREGYYYLFWCICDGYCGCYDNRTFVIAARDLRGFRDLAPIAMLSGHAPEIVTDTDGSTWLLSVFYLENGVSAVRLAWEK